MRAPFDLVNNAPKEMCRFPRGACTTSHPPCRVVLLVVLRWRLVSSTSLSSIPGVLGPVTVVLCAFMVCLFVSRTKAPFNPLTPAPINNESIQEASCTPAIPPCFAFRHALCVARQAPNPVFKHWSLLGPLIRSEVLSHHARRLVRLLLST